MARITQEERRRLKRETIMKGARSVFERKGFTDATIQDIIDECGISRGGIYLYFKSVSEVFIAVLTEDDKQYFQEIHSLVGENHPFEKLMDSFFAFHRKRLLGDMYIKLNRSMYEFFFSRPNKSSFDFQKLSLSRNIISEILEQGVREGKLEDHNISAYTDNLIFTLEGMGILATMQGLTEEALEMQFEIMRQSLPYKTPIVPEDGSGG